MAEHRSHHRSEPEPPKKTAKDYAWIGAAITALGAILGGHTYDRNSNLDVSENMHRGVLSHVETEITFLKFRVRQLEGQNQELHRYIHNVKPSAPSGRAGAPPPAGGWTPQPPPMPSPTEFPRTRSGADVYEMIKQKAREGEVYRPQGGYSH